MILKSVKNKPKNKRDFLLVNDLANNKSMSAPARMYLLLWLLNLGHLPMRTSLSGQLIQLVDPIFGTGGDGNCFPGATSPFGMIQVGNKNGMR